MKKLTGCLIGLVVVSCFIFGAVSAAVATPKFMAKQVVINGKPENVPAGYKVVKYLERADVTVVEVQAGTEENHVQNLRAKGHKANLNLIYNKVGTVNDPRFSQQWNFTKVQATQAWDITTGAGAVVAVVDTGLARGGFDGIGCVLPGYDFVNTDSDPADGDGHGTHVSGTIAQTTNNSIGCAGLAYGACILPVKVLGDDGNGTSADIAEGIYWSANNGADVINMSLGGGFVTNDPIIDPALEYAYSRNVTVVCAAGNQGSRKTVSYPAIYPTTIAVGATDSADKVPDYSNKGIGLDIVAPGDGILQETLVTPIFGTQRVWDYYTMSGTSMAAPHVAAVAALLYASGKAVTPDTVYQALTATALDLGRAGWDTYYGHGLLQAYKALTADPGSTGGCMDNDGDGWCVEDGDCNDNDAAIYPGHTESGKFAKDKKDNDCNGLIDK